MMTLHFGRESVILGCGMPPPLLNSVCVKGFSKVSACVLVVVLWWWRIGGPRAGGG